MQPISSSSNHSLVIDVASIGDLASSSQPEKRYLKDYPDSDKTYDAKYGRTFVKDSTGVILLVPDEIQDRLVLENSSDSRLQQLARRYVLMQHPLPQEWALYKQIIEEFGEKETETATQLFFDEKHNLHSPEARAFARRFLVLKDWVDKTNKWWDENTYIGQDGQRHSKILPRRATFSDVMKEIGHDISRGYSSLKRNHPRAVLAAKVSAVALALFFLRTLRSFSASRSLQ